MSTSHFVVFYVIVLGTSLKDVLERVLPRNGLQGLLFEKSLASVDIPKGNLNSLSSLSNGLINTALVSTYIVLVNKVMSCVEDDLIHFMNIRAAEYTTHLVGLEDTFHLASDTTMLKENFIVHALAIFGKSSTVSTPVSCCMGNDVGIDGTVGNIPKRKGLVSCISLEPSILDSSILGLPEIQPTCIEKENALSLIV